MENTGNFKHQRTESKYENKFNCCCGLKFDTIENLNLHLQKPINCDVCDKSFKHLSEFKTHIYEECNDGQIECTDCNENITQNCKLKRHNSGRQHAYKSRPNLCNKRLKQFYRALRHRQIRKMKKRCNYCGKISDLKKQSMTRWTVKTKRALQLEQQREIEQQLQLLKLDQQREMERRQQQQQLLKLQQQREMEQQQLEQLQKIESQQQQIRKLQQEREIDQRLLVQLEQLQKEERSLKQKLLKAQQEIELLKHLQVLQQEHLEDLLLHLHFAQPQEEQEEEDEEGEEGPYHFMEEE